MYGDHPDLHVLTHSVPTRRSSDRIYSDSDEACAAGEMCIEKREIARQNSRWLSRGKDAGQRAHRELAHPLPVGASQEPGRRCQLGWTDEKRVDPVDAGDCFDILDPLNRPPFRSPTNPLIATGHL